MARVFLASGLRSFTGGATEIEVDASTVRELIAGLDEKFPGLGERLSSGTAVAIDGEIMNEADYLPVHPQAEVHFLPPLSGG